MQPGGWAAAAALALPFSVRRAAGRRVQHREQSGTRTLVEGTNLFLLRLLALRVEVLNPHVFLP